MSALKVQVTQERDSPIQFIVRLSATIAGICVISGEYRGDCLYTFCMGIIAYIKPLSPI
jgi:hypothetical protein